MDHTYYFDGNEKSIAWIIENKNVQEKQTRTHAENYYQKVSAEQSKYIALHVEIFWGIGRFIIKDEDMITIMLDTRSMYEYLSENKMIDDLFIATRIQFIKKLIDQRGLKIRYQMITANQNKASILFKS